VDTTRAAGPSRSSGRVLDRRAGRHGELALIERDGACELISNGVFLMDTRDGRSERLLVRAACDHATRPVRRLLLGGLGVGFSLAEAADLGVPAILVVECEPAVVAWNRSHTGSRTGGSVDRPGVRCEVADLVEWLQRPTAGVRPTDADQPFAAEDPFDVICLDVENGPDWLVGPTNAWLYTDEGVRAVRERLADGGALSVWSAAPAPTYEGRLRRHFGVVAARTLDVARGTPDVVYVARP
jgi:spermidine synthase